ncbi:three component ABC system middle component [Niabella insulamsoli]|uniref:three component ABC system middle component n=1 Tax=Niabella insulamsoli TaxID=3144874 RepID=UPI0031FC9F9A
MKSSAHLVGDTNLFELLQNDALGVIALHSFTLGYHNVAKRKEHKLDFPKLEYMFFVLPIVYNYSSLAIFLSSNEVYTALHKEPTIRLGLQERAAKMAGQTFDAMNVAFSKRILGYQKENATITLLRPFSSNKLILPLSSNSPANSVKKIQTCSYKVGNIFAKRNEKNIQQELNIVF